MTKVNDPYEEFKTRDDVDYVACSESSMKAHLDDGWEKVKDKPIDGNFLLAKSKKWTETERADREKTRQRQEASLGKAGLPEDAYCKTKIRRV